MHKTSALYNARLLAALLKAHGCQHLVVSPGSRNAPLIVALAGDPEYQTYSVPDERAAAFTALGMALESGRPAAVLCTSGSAAANFLPAVTEAYYQKQPLIVITADRPQEWIDQGIGQTIRQAGLFHRHVLAEANLQREPQDELGRQYNQRILNQALLQAQEGPVHINVPFEEPLYDQVAPNTQEVFRVVRSTAPYSECGPIEDYLTAWEQAEKVWVLVGQMAPDPELIEALKQLQARRPFLLLRESLSNMPELPGIATIDRFLNATSAQEKQDLAPDLLISLGGEIVSKMVKQSLLKQPPKQHWHFSKDPILKDSFFALEQQLSYRPALFFRRLAEALSPQAQAPWLERALAYQARSSDAAQAFLAQAPHSDLKVMAQIREQLPHESILHCANSASVRYAQLMEWPAGVRHYANRGTSGIDGSTSTALGHALQTEALVSLVSGDVAFLYDSAAFWNDRLPANLKIIVINNEGGNIFRIIKGPASIEGFERFQETHHQLNLAGVALTYKLPFTSVDNSADTALALKEMYSRPGLEILEIKTPREASPDILMQYFKALRNH